MRKHETSAIVLGFPDYRQPAQRLAQRAGFDYADIDIHDFPDGESRLRLPPELPRHTILYTSLDQANRRLVQYELAAATALELGAERLTLIAPYLCYMRQDTAFEPGEAVSQRLIGRFLARHLDGLITVDPHLHRTHELCQAVPVNHAITLSAAPVFTEWLTRNADAPLLVGPDAESAQWLGAIAEPGNIEYGVALKERRGDREVRIHLPDLDFKGRQVVIIDDVASTGQTLAETARQIARLGAATITVLVSHALFVGDAIDRLHSAGVTDVHSTDSIPHPSNLFHLDALLADALKSCCPQ